MLHRLRPDERHDHQRQRERIVQVARDEATTQRVHDDSRGHPADDDAGPEGEPDALNHVQRRVEGAGRCIPGLVQEEKHLQHEHRQHGAHRVDCNALPLRHGPHPPLRPNFAQQGHHHRRPRDHQDGPGEQRQPDAEVLNQVHGTCAQKPCDKHPDRNQVQNGAALRLQFREAQVQSTLKQNDPDGDRDERVHPFALQHRRVDDPEHGPGQEAGQQEQQNGRQAGLPRQPLRPHA